MRHKVVTLVIATFRWCVLPSSSVVTQPPLRRIPEDLPNVTYCLLEDSALCCTYRPSKLNLTSIVNESVSLMECGWTHSATTVQCCRHPPDSPDLIPTHFGHYLTWNPPSKISGCGGRQEESNRRKKCRSFGHSGWLFMELLQDATRLPWCTPYQGVLYFQNRFLQRLSRNSQKLSYAEFHPNRTQRWKK